MRITVATFRRIGKIEESMIRAAMPRTSENDSAPLAPFAGRPEVNLLARRAGCNLVAPLTASIAEHTNG